MICNKCKSEVNETDKFCKKCGNNLQLAKVKLLKEWILLIPLVFFGLYAGIQYSWELFASEVSSVDGSVSGLLIILLPFYLAFGAVLGFIPGVAILLSVINTKKKVGYCIGEIVLLLISILFFLSITEYNGLLGTIGIIINVVVILLVCYNIYLIKKVKAK